jgi:hypothetical protein
VLAAAVVPEGGALKMDCWSSVTSTCVPGGRYVPSNFANVFDFVFAYSILYPKFSICFL